MKKVDVMEIENVVKKYSKILSISDENIDYKNQDGNNQAELGYNRENLRWIVYYKKDCKRFAIIHELGHIYFAKKKVNYLGFAKPPPLTPQTNKNLVYILSNLIDCFVNYNLSVFEPIYLEIKEYFHNYLKDLDSIKERIQNSSNFLLILSFYFLYYIEFKFILKKEERDMMHENMNNLLNTLKSHWIKNDDRLSPNKFKSIDRMLTNFDTFKSTNNYKDVLKYFSLVLTSTSIWDVDYINNQLNLIFPKSD